MNKLSLLVFVTAMSLNLSVRADDLQIQKENEDFYKQLDQIVQSVAPRKTSKWSLSQLSLNTSKTHDGLFGFMPFKGTATSTLTWIPKTKSSKIFNANSEIKSFDLKSSPEDISQVASVWYREFLRAKQLPWTTNNEKDFLKLLMHARSIAQEIASIYHPEWAIDQFVVERGLSVKGKLAPLFSVDAAFAVRFSFDLNSAKSSQMNRPGELTSLVLGLAEDLSNSAKTFQLPAWSIDGFNIGLGISPLLGIGIVNAKPHAFAHMTFKARKKSKMMSSALRQQILALTSDHMKLFDYSPEDETKVSAQSSTEKAYIIDREKFRKGLAYALGLARNMTLQADKGDSADKNWRLGQVVYRYEAGVQGQLLFAGLSGKIGAEVRLIKELTAKNSSAPSELPALSSSESDLQKALKLELQDNKTILNMVPAGGSLSGIESSAFLKFNWGIESPVAELKISAIPQVRLKFNPSK